jgi:peptidoglycan/LPS O-acetylase OafA/YrhL
MRADAPQTTIHPSPVELKPLTSLRFFAAMMIAILHLQEDFTAPWHSLSGGGLRQGVSFFFVLSGFILTHVYIDQPGLTLRRFLTLRLARLYPTHIAALALLIAVLPWSLIVYSSPSPDVTGPALVAKILLVDSIVPTAPIQYAWNGVSWSLSTEMFFYLAFPLLLIDFRATWRKKLALAALVTALAYLGASALGMPFAGTRADVPTIYQAAYGAPLARGFEFVLGMAAYVFFERVIAPLELSRAWWTIIETSLLLALLYWVFVGCNATASRLPTLPHLWMIVSGSCWLFALVIAFFAPARGIIGAALSSAPMVWLGQISFSFYMVHQIVLRAFAWRWGPEAPVAIVLVTALLAAAAIFYLVETPGRRRILALSRRGKPAPLDAAAKA